MNAYERREQEIVSLVENGDYRQAASALRARHHDPAGFRYPQCRHRLLQRMGIGHLCARFYPVDVRGEHRSTLLMLNTMQGNLEEVALLPHRGANPELRDQSGRTALDYANEYHQAAIAELLQLWQKLHLARYPLPHRTPHLPRIVQKILGVTNQ